MDFFSEWLGELGIKSEVTVRESARLTKDIVAGEYDVFHWGWYVESDPATLSRYFTCDQRALANDSWYCDPEYDALYKAQSSEMDKAKRVEMVQEMQKMIFEDVAVPRPRLHSGRAGLPLRPVRLLRSRSRSPTACW